MFLFIEHYLAFLFIVVIMKRKMPSNAVSLLVYHYVHTCMHATVYKAREYKVAIGEHVMQASMQLVHAVVRVH